MLHTLHIRDFVIVDELELNFAPGFTVFSGETGAGKSILVDAVSLVLGARGDAGVVRPGARQANISAWFKVPQALEDWLKALAIDTDEGLLLRRSVDTQGRSRAYINGLPTTLTQLRELATRLIDIHGQHAHQSLLQAGQQREMLDAQGGHLPLARTVRQAWQSWQAAEQALEQAHSQARARAEENRRLQWQLEELDALGMAADEWAALTAEHGRLAHAQALLDGGARALDALDAEAGGARRQLSFAHQQLSPLLQHDRSLAEIHEGLESALITVDATISDLNAYLSRLELDPDALARAENRMAAIFGLARKLHTEPEELCALQEQLRQQLQANEDAGNLDALAQKRDEAKTQFHDRAKELSTVRGQTARRLAGEVTQAMQTLAMEGGRFDIRLSPAEAGPHGLETVVFLVAGHAGATPRPLAKVASGGELARLSLALSVIASQAAQVPTLIFDEVDAGIGGGVAEVVGRLLDELGQRHQVLCVTHLPQVAARGRQHFAVRKTSHQGQPVSRISELDAPARTEEIARMLGGLTITETTRRHAEEMLRGH